MVAALVALVLAQDLPDLFGPPPDPRAPAPLPLPSKKRDAPLVIPPADGPVPEGVPTPAPEVEKPAFVRRPHDDTRERLMDERLHLLDARPTLTAPTVMMTGGAIGMIIGAVVTLVLVASPAFRSPDQTPLYVTSCFDLLAVGAFGFGIVWLRESWLIRDLYGERIEALDQELGW
jgi:hypothetical protein